MRKGIVCLLAAVVFILTGVAESWSVKGLLPGVSIESAAAQTSNLQNTDPCGYAGLQKTTVTKSITTATTTALVAVPGATQSLYVCSWQILHPGGTGTMALEYGTGTACATGATLLRAAFAYNTAAGTPTIDQMTGGDSKIVVPAGNGLCALSTGTITQVVTVTYVQTGPM